ncbi:CCA tRNA nucleotidyltransferase [Candidatus Curtissbacteria bacterium]|nr:CCA tRNA nucleotidyltransferase [Candidatus Curtissbacteria bacterium]
MKLDSRIETILAKLSARGFEVAIVGGAVRDILEDKSPSDWDLATNATPAEILKLFKGAFYNNKFGTVGVPTRGENIEITTYRSETGYSDRRHPDRVVWGKTLEEDLLRRDFTINAMALRYAQGKLVTTPVDPFGGQEDFKNKIIRAVGDADRRFDEDALRLLRAVRFATTLNFTIDKKTKKAISKNADLLSEISGERVRDELLKILESDNAFNGILLLKETGILAVVLPELADCFAVEQKSPKRHHVYDVGTHCVFSLKHCSSKDVIVRLATLLHDVGKARVANVTEEGIRTFYNHEVVGGRMAAAIAKRLHLSREARDKLFKLVRWHQFSVGENQTDRALRRFIRNIGVANIEDMMDLRVGDRLGGGLQQPESWRLKLFRQRLIEVMKKPFTVADLKVDGNDVMETLKIKPGPKVGEVLKALFEEVCDDASKNNREYLFSRLKEFKG